MASQFDFRPGESLADYNIRIDLLNQEIGSFSEVLDSIRELSSQACYEPHTAGFMRAWIEFMFVELDEAQRARVMGRFSEYSGELGQRVVMSKLEMTE